MRWTAERISLTDTLFLGRSSEKRYEFIRYTETYQFSQLRTLLSGPPHAKQSELKSGKCGENFVEALNAQTAQPTFERKKGGGDAFWMKSRMNNVESGGLPSNAILNISLG